MQNQTLINNTTPEELTEKIMIGVEALIKESIRPHVNDELLTRKDVCQLLKIDLSTLWHWTKKGKLIAYGIESRIYYKRAEIDLALKPLK